MLCERCGQEPATFHMVQNVNGQQSEVHLCGQCAAAQGEFGSQWHTPFDIHQFLAGLLSQSGLLAQTGGAPGAQVTSVACPTCGLRYAEFTRSGLLGCPDCYATFAEQLDPLLRRMHGSSLHAGKYPARGGKRLKVSRRLAELKQQLQEAITAQAFERAAELRDEIRRLEQGEGNRRGH